MKWTIVALIGLLALGGLEASERRIVVDLSAQKLIALEGQKIVFEFPCSTGRRGLETPTGVVLIQKKKRHARALPELGGGATPFALQIYMHDQKQGRVRRLNIHGYSDVPQYPASSGCVRLRVADAEELFGWAQVGTPVEIVERYTKPAPGAQEKPARLALVIESGRMAATLYGDNQGKWEPVRQMPVKHFVDEALVLERAAELPEDWPYGEFFVHALRSNSTESGEEARWIEIRRAIPGKKNHSWWLRITFSDQGPSERHSAQILLPYDEWPGFQHLESGDKVLIKR